MELNGNGKSLNKAGAYKHRETGKIVWLNEMPGVGTPTIDAFIQVGFVKCDDSEFVKPEVVSEPTTESGSVEVVDGDKFTETETKTGKIQYRKNGKLISKEEYLNK